MKLSPAMFIFAVQIASSSSSDHDDVIHLDEGTGFEEVAENFHFVHEVVDAQSYLRGASNVSSAMDQSASIGFEGYSSGHDNSEDEDYDEEYDEKGDDVEIMEGSGRHLQTTPNKILKKTSNRDKQWLDSHNNRRKRYHEMYDTEYVPLMWSKTLKKQSKVWAKHLAQLCGETGIYHDPSNGFGENLASNYGTGRWAKRPTPDSVMTRFVEDELGLSPPMNYHATQVLWRATAYVGCAEAQASSNLGNGMQCHVQVCRYARPGNCNMAKYDSWEEPMLKDESPCPPFCPPGGCY